MTEQDLISLGFEKQLRELGNPNEGHYYTFELLEDDYEDLALVSTEDFTVELFPYSKKFDNVEDIEQLIKLMRYDQKKKNHKNHPNNNMD